MLPPLGIIGTSRTEKLLNSTRRFVWVVRKIFINWHLLIFLRVYCVWCIGWLKVHRTTRYLQVGDETRKEGKYSFYLLLYTDSQWYWRSEYKQYAHRFTKTGFEKGWNPLETYQTHARPTAALFEFAQGCLQQRHSLALDTFYVHRNEYFCGENSKQPCFFVSSLSAKQRFKWDARRNGEE